MPISNSGRPLSLLVVEDNRDSADSLAFVLRNCGYSVSIAYDGDEAVRMIDALAFHVVICDIGLPGRSGFEVGAHFRHRHGTEPLMVAVSAYTADTVREHAQLAGFNEFFSKPAEPTELERVVRRHAARALEDTGEINFRLSKVF